MADDTIKIWHVEATRKAAEILGIDTDTLTHEQYETFEDLVWPLYESEDFQVRQDIARALRAACSPL